MYLIYILIIRQKKTILNSYYMGEWGIHKKLHERLLKLIVISYSQINNNIIT